MPSSFQELETRLDPSGTYLVFEKHSKTPAPLEFEAVADLLRAHESAILARDTHYDRGAARLFLILKLDPGDAQQVYRALIQTRLPRDIAMYLYQQFSAPQAVAMPKDSAPKSRS